MKDIPKCNKEWIEGLKGKIKIMIVSNGVDRDMEKYFKETGIEYIGFACKPLKKNFINACEKMNVNPESVLMVGDSLFDDIYGGKRNNMKKPNTKGKTNKYPCILCFCSRVYSERFFFTFI